MRVPFLVIVIISIIAYFLFMSVGYGQQTSINAVVPLTPQNMASTVQVLEEKQNPLPIQKENKYLYFFQKSLEMEDNKTELIGQTVHDKYASYGFMVGILFICTIILILFLRLGEYLLAHFKHYDYRSKKV